MSEDLERRTSLRSIASKVGASRYAPRLKRTNRIVVNLKSKINPNSQSRVISDKRDFQ